MSQPREQQPQRAEIEIDVRYAETDQMGVVHHANYLIWFELARTYLCEISGLHYAEIEKAGYYLMVTGANVRYRLGARYGDRVAVSVWLAKLGSRVAEFEYEIRRGETLLTTGSTHHVWVRAEGARTCRIPELARPYFEALAGRPLRSAPTE